MWKLIRARCVLLVPGYGRPVLLCRDRMPGARGMAAYVRDGFGAFCQPKFECGSCEMLFFRACGVRQNFYVFSLYRNPDHDDRISDCLLTSMAAVQAEDEHGSFLFVGDSNAVVVYTDDLGWYPTSNKQEQMLVQNLSRIVSR